MPVPTIAYLTDIYFGAGQIRSLPEILKQFGIYRPLVVTDRGLEELGMVDRLNLSVAAVFSEISTNPDEESVVTGVQVFREHGCDGVIALGGGSPMDCAKCISLLMTHPEPLGQYALIRGGIARITADKPPLVAIPTTAGTGSEVGRAALVTMHGGTKLGVISKHMIPNAALCDPELTIDMPSTLTAATGMDAISHCVETFCSPKYNPVADSIALDGLARAWQNLPVVMEQPNNLQARTEMMMAALQGALAFQKGLGLIHSLSHPLGAIGDRRLHHGTLNAVFLPHVLRFNATSCPEKIQRMAAAIGVSGGVEELAEAFVRLNLRIGMPANLREMGLTEANFENIVEAAIEDHSTPSNPRELTIENCREVLQAAY